MFFYLSLTRMKFPSIVALVAVTNADYAADKPLPPYLEDLKWEAPRSLSNWSNLTVQTRTGTLIGILNDTYPNVRQFLRVPLDASTEASVFAQEIRCYDVRSRYVEVNTSHRPFINARFLSFCRLSLSAVRSTGRLVLERLRTG